MHASECASSQENVDMWYKVMPVKHEPHIKPSKTLKVFLFPLGWKACKMKIPLFETIANVLSFSLCGMYQGQNSNDYIFSFVKPRTVLTFLYTRGARQVRKPKFGWPAMLEVISQVVKRPNHLNVPKKRDLNPGAREMVCSHLQYQKHMLCIGCGGGN